MARSRGVRLDADALRLRRRELGLTQAEVADLSGVTARTVQSAEQGALVASSSAKAIAAALGLPLATLRRVRASEVQASLACRGYAPVPAPTPWGERSDETRAVLSALRFPGKRVVCCLTGPSGIGKTALARYVAAQLDPAEHDGIAWVSMPRHRDGQRIGDTMLDIAEALRVRSRMPPPHAVEFEALCQAFRSAYWSRRRLLILDDVATPEEVAPFVGEKEPVWALVTSARRNVAEALGGSTVVVGPLSLNASTVLLEEHIGSARMGDRDGGGRRLAEVLGGVPRAVQIAGQILRRERYTTPNEYAAQIDATTSAGLAARGPEGARLLEEDELFVRAYAQLQQRMHRESWGLLARLSVFEDRAFSRRWAEAVASGEAPLGPALGELVDMFLLQEVAAGDGAEPRFALDAQALRVARAIGSGHEGEVRRRMLRFAHAEARRLAAIAPVRAHEALGADLDVWTLCLERSSQCVLGVAGLGPATSPEAVHTLAREPGPPSALALLPETLALLEVPLVARYLPGTGAWLTAGLAVARSQGAAVLEGRLCRLLARWWCLGPAAYDIAPVFAHHSVALLKAAGAAKEASRSLLYLAAALYSGGGAKRSLPATTEAVATARACGASKERLAAALHSFASTLAQAAETRDQWDEAKRAFEEAMALVEGLPLPARLFRSAALVSVAVMELREGHVATRPGVAEALSDLREVVRDEGVDLVRLAWLEARLCNARNGSTAKPPRRRDLHAAIQAVPRHRTLRRIIKIAEFAIFTADARFASSPDDGAIPSGLCMTELVMGTVLEAELGLFLNLLYPINFIQDMMDERTIDLAVRFARQTCPTGHILHGLLAQLVNYRSASRHEPSSESTTAIAPGEILGQPVGRKST